MPNSWENKNAYLIFLPLLVLYLVLVFLFATDTFIGDEDGYIKIATHIAGRAAPGEPNTLWWGPGYPMVLVPFVLLKIPWFYAKLLNAVFLFLAILYFYNTLALWVPKKAAIIIALVYGLYPPFMREIHVLYTENLVFFLICGFMYHFCRMCRPPGKTWPHFLLAAVFMGYLALTKVFFGYVLVVGILVFLGWYVFKREARYARTSGIFLLALIFCVPYLLYTYSVTNKVFYWGTSGGMSLYWMSTPHEEELGDWFIDYQVAGMPELARHRAFFDKIAKLPEVEQDAEYRKQAIYNITHYPKKYIKNWVANVGRLLFSYPYSYTEQKLSTFFYLLPNMFLFVLTILGIYPAVKRWRAIPFEMYVFLFFVLVTLGGTSLVSGYDRQFRPLVPVIMLWLSYIYIRVLNIKIRPDNEIT